MSSLTKFILAMLFSAAVGFAIGLGYAEPRKSTNFELDPCAVSRCLFG